MEKYKVLYNPLSGNGRGTADTLKLKEIMPDCEFEFIDLIGVNDYKEFLASVPAEEKVILSGGDGTLNRFINDTYGMDYGRDIYYFATGSGNDFLNDLNKKVGDKPFIINEYIKDLPAVFIDDRKWYFLNNVAYGLDGYACEEGDKIRATSDKPVNYTNIVLKGLLYAFKPTNAKITVDGKTYEYDHVWLAPSMNGRFYGGGMMMTPMQDRLNADKHVTAAVVHSKSKFNLIAAFPSIFKGTHTKLTKVVSFFPGHDVTVEFDRPTAVQIDGETVVNVTKYHVLSAVALKAQKEKETATV